MMEKKIMETMPDDLHIHCFAMSGEKEVYIALDTLPIGISDPFTSKTYHYETMIFSGNSEKAEVDWGNELFQERYETSKEAIIRAKEIGQHLMQGYTVEEIPPQGFHLEVVDQPQEIHGIELTKYDSLLKDEKGEVYTIVKSSEIQKDISRLTVYSRFCSADPFRLSPPNESGTAIIPLSAFLKKVSLYKKQEALRNQDKNELQHDSSDQAIFLS